MSEIMRMKCVLKDAPIPQRGKFPVLLVEADEFYAHPMAVARQNKCWQAVGFKSEHKHATIHRLALLVAIGLLSDVDDKEDRISLDMLQEEQCVSFAVVTTGRVEGNTLVCLPHGHVSIEEVMTFPEHQKKGLARSVMSEIMAELIRHRCYDVAQLVCRPGLVSLYEKFNFKKVEGVM